MTERKLRFPKLSQSRIRQITMVLLMACVGSYVLGRSYAATFAVHSEAEAGALTGEAAAVAAQAGASNNASVRFGGSAPVGNCLNNVKHTPGGPDDMGGCWPSEDNTGVP